MTASLTATRKPMSLSFDEPIERALKLLSDALQIIDEEEMPPEIGACLDHVICSLQDLMIETAS